MRNINGAVEGRLENHLPSSTPGRSPSPAGRRTCCKRCPPRVNYQLTAGADGRAQRQDGHLRAHGRGAHASRRPLPRCPFPTTPAWCCSTGPPTGGNLGTILRSLRRPGGLMASFSTGHGVDLYDPEVIVSSMGLLLPGAGSAGRGQQLGVSSLSKACASGTRASRCWAPPPTSSTPL